MIDHNLAYVTMDDDGGLIIGKFLMKVPQGIKVELPEIPYLLNLESGQTIHRRIRIPQPAATYDPYSNHPVAIETSRIQVARLCIGIIDSLAFADDEAVIEPASGVGHGLFNCSYGLGLRYQEIWESTIKK